MEFLAVCIPQQRALPMKPACGTTSAPVCCPWYSPHLHSAWSQPMDTTTNKDFWLSCGHHLLDRDAGGGLVATDEFLKVYLARPELAPPPEACAAERALHGVLLAEPRRPVSAGEIASIADADARENWQVMLGFRDHLLRHRTI